MKTATTNWVKWIVAGGGVLLILSLATSFLMPFLWRGVGGIGHVGCNSWDDSGMMANWGNTGMMMYSPFGWLGMFLNLLFSLGLLVLLTGGAAWLLRNRTPQS